MSERELLPHQHSRNVILLYLFYSEAQRFTKHRKETARRKKIAFWGESKKRTRESSKQHKKRILCGIHYKDVKGHVLDKEPSDAFSVLLTFSLSPKRHVVVPGSIHQIRLAEKTVGRKNKTKPCGSFLSAETGGDRLSEKVSIRLQHQSCRTLRPSTPQRTALLYAFLLESGLRRGGS